jgi:hypothetical protein
MIKDIGELLAAEAEAAEAHRGAVRAETPGRSTACASPLTGWPSCGKSPTPTCRAVSADAPMGARPVGRGEGAPWRGERRRAAPRQARHARRLLDEVPQAEERLLADTGT